MDYAVIKIINPHFSPLPFNHYILPVVSFSGDVLKQSPATVEGCVAGEKLLFLLAEQPSPSLSLTFTIEGGVFRKKVVPFFRIRRRRTLPVTVKMPLIDLFFDRVFVDFLKLRAKLLDPPGSSLDPSYLLYKFFLENFMKPTSEAARDKLLREFNSSTVPWGPANFAPEPVSARELRYWKRQWLEEKEKKAREKVVEETAQSLPPTEGESEWAKLNREMSSHPNPYRYFYWEWLYQQEKEKERCAAEGKVYVDPVTKPRYLMEMKPARGEWQLMKDDTSVRRHRYCRPSHPIYKQAIARYHRKYPELHCLQYLTPAERKARGLQYVPFAKRTEQELIDYNKNVRRYFDSLYPSPSVKEEEEIVDMSLGHGEDEIHVEEEEVVQEEVDEEWPSIQKENVEEVVEEEVDDEWPSIEEESVDGKYDVKEEEEDECIQEEEYVEEENDAKEKEEDDEWPSIQEEEFDLKEEEEDAEWPSIQEEEYVQEELDRLAQEEQSQEEEDVERPFDEEENAEEAVKRPLVQEENDVGKRKDKRRWWWRRSWVLNKSLLVLALLILALFCGLCIYSSSSVTYQNDGVGLSLKIHMSLPHPSRFRVDELIRRVTTRSFHVLTQSSWLPYRFMYMADCDYDGWLTPT